MNHTMGNTVGDKVGNPMDEDTKPEPCKDCGTDWYPSPNPERRGQWEHLCLKTHGVIFVQAGWPDSLSKEDVAKHKEKEEKKKPK